MWRLQGSGAIFICWVSVKLRLLFTAGPYWQVVSARCTVWIFIDLWNLRPQNACSLSFLRPALKICVKNADFCVNANPGSISYLHINFKKCVACKVCFEVKKFEILPNSLNFKFDVDFFWLWIQYDSIVWVIMRQLGVSSECTCSSCSTYILFAEWYIINSTTICKLVDPIQILHQSDCRIPN